MNLNHHRRLVALLQPLAWLGLTITLGLVYVVIGAIVFHGGDIQPFRDLFGDENLFLLGLVGVATAPWVAAWPFAFWLGPKWGALAGGLAGTPVVAATLWLKAPGMTWGLDVGLLLVGAIVGGLTGAIGRLTRAPVPGKGDTPPEGEGRVSKPPALGRFRAAWLSLVLCVLAGGWFSWEARGPLLVQALKWELFRAHDFDQLIAVHPKSRRALIEALKDQEVEVRRLATKALGRIGREAKEAMPALIEALKDTDWDVRQGAANALGCIGPGAKEAVPALMQALNDPVMNPRWLAAWALGEIGPGAKVAVPVLIEALKDPIWLVRGESANALGRIDAGAKEAVAALIQALKDSEEDVRLAAARALGHIGPGTKDAMSTLTETSQRDPNPIVRAAAAEALKKIDPEGTEKQ